MPKRFGSAAMMRRLGLALLGVVGGGMPAAAFRLSDEFADSPFVSLLLAPARGFQERPVQATFDTTISYGVSMRTQKPDPSLVAISNGGTAGNINGDDGNLNFSKGDVISNAVKVTHELDVSSGDFGAFVRGSYFYDFANMARESLSDVARRRVGHHAELLDAYFRGTFHPFGQTTQVRLGQQVVNWGESSFIPNGLSVANAVDLSKLRVPGAEIKEALLPTPMAWASQSVGKFLSLEGFALARYDHVRTDPRGTYFSPDDALSDGGNALYVGSGRRYDQHFPPTPVSFTPAIAVGQIFGVRAGDQEAEDSGQAGVALHLFAPALHNTEFGFYHAKYHSRTPFLSGVRGGVSVANPANFGCGGATPYVDMARALGTPSPFDNCTGTPAAYRADYPEDIRLYGFSFNTTGPWGLSLQGEHSYRPNQPVQYTPTEVALAAGGLQTFLSGNALTAMTVPYGADIKGYRRLEVHQSQVTASKVLGPILGIDVLTLAGEVGYAHMNLPEGQFFAGPSATIAPGSNPGTGPGAVPSTAPIQGAATKDSWGYRLTARLDFLNKIFQTNISPRVTFSHDVKGVSPTFNQNSKAISYGCSTAFKSSWVWDISYTNFFGGRIFRSTNTAGTVPAGQPLTSETSTNLAKDRDFITTSLSYSF